MTTLNLSSLLADVGGTHTRIARASGRVLDPASVLRFNNCDFASFEDLIRAYQAEFPARTETACIAMAGPVKGSREKLTNLDWVIDTDTIRDICRMGEIYLLNDLQAQGYAIASLPDESLLTVLDGPAPRPEATRVVIGIGTGFNAAPIHQTGRDIRVDAMEWGHVGLSAVTKQERLLQRQITKRHGFASIEDVLSGRGLTEVDACLNAPQPGRTSFALFADASKGDPTAIKSLRLVTAILGRITGDIARAHNAHGGVYLTGGIARKLAPFLTDPSFQDAFRTRGRCAPDLSDVAVRIVCDDFAALSGCLHHLLQIHPPYACP